MAIIVPGIVEDGDFSVIAQNGAWTPSFPFAKVGDFTTFTMSAKFRVNENDWVRPIPMSQLIFPGYGIAYLVDISNPQSVNGSELVDYDFVYASIPISRIEYGSATHQIQYAIADQNNKLQILSYNDTFDSQQLYEYSAFNPLPQLFRGILINPGTATGQIAQAGVWAQPGQRMLAQNSTTEIYKGLIFQRLSVSVFVPNIFYGVVNLHT